MGEISKSRVRVRRLAAFTAALVLFMVLFLVPTGAVEPIGGGVSRVSSNGSSGVFAPVVKYGRPTVLPWLMTHLPNGYGPDDPATPACLQDAWTVASLAHGGHAAAAWRVLDMGRRDDVSVGDTYTTEPTGALAVKLPVAVDPVPPFELRGATGCSLTLAITLTFWDVLDGGVLLDGRSVAATGTVDTAGRVGDISGESYKGAAVAAEGIDVLFASPLDAAELAASAGPTVTVIAVSEVSDVIDWLESHP